MKLTGQNIRHINTITHDGKVLVFGTAEGGAVYYSVKRSGFEDTALQEGADPFGFEDWKPLALGGSTPDASVVARDQKNLLDGDKRPILRSVHGAGADVTKSVDAPVQLVSAAGHLFVFRQGPGDGGRILVNRFVLDGMTNALVPKLEVRFRRSGQRFEPQKSATSGAGAVFDNLDYRDIDGKSFLEPALELSFAGPAGNGWFAPLFVPTIEPDRGRWHLFVYDGKEGRIVLYTVGADAEGAFDVKDYLFGQVDPAKPDVTLYRPIPGIIRRALDLQGLTVAGGPSVTTYDVQREQITDTGPQLMRDTSRVMLAVPVRGNGAADPVKTAILDFAIATDGTLSQIDGTPDKSPILRSVSRELITPLTLLDDIKEFAATQSLGGTIVATERGADDLLQIRSRDSLPAELVQGAKVWVRGTQSYDGFYKVVGVDGATFRVEASFQNNEAGFWEVVPDKATGLVFDNMIVGTEKSVDGKLKVLCAAHDLKVGDELQITGTRVADGTFPIKSVDATKSAFVLDTPFFAGQVANLTRVMRRGLRMDVGDRVDSPDLGLEPPSRERDLGRTISAWVRIDAAGKVDQSLLRDSGGLMSLAVGADGKVKLSVRMSDGATRAVVDPNPLVAGAWAHYAGSVAYTTRSAGDTVLTLCRGGVEVATQKIPHGLPCHLDNLLPSFEGSQYIDMPSTVASLITGSFTVTLWARLTGGAGSHRAALSCRGSLTGLTVYVNPDNRWEIQTGNGSAWAGLLGPAAVEGAWTHLAIVVQGPTMSLYVNGGTPISAPTTIRMPDQALRIGGGAPEGQANYFWRGNVADVSIWKRALSSAEINEGMTVRHTGTEADLVAYWPLDNGAGRDLSRAKRHGAPKSGLAFVKTAYVHPQITPPAASNAKKAMVMSFDGVADHVEVPAFPSPTAAATVAVWAKSATATWNASGCLVSKRGAFVLYPIVGDRRIAMTFQVNGATAEASFTPPDIQSWHHYAGTWDGSTIRFYIDGALVAQTNAPGKLPPNADGALRIGRDDEGGVARYFNGQIADVQVWSVARSQVEIAADMNRRLTGAESGLAGYWPLDVGPSDLSPLRRNGALKGKPARSTDGSSFTVGGGFRGEIAEAQVWSRARTAAEVKATMHLALTGGEAGLELDYRLGAVSYETIKPSVPDFSVHGRSGEVTGEPYAGARQLKRQIAAGRVVQYRSAELLAVSQRGLYEESFEFKVTSPDPNFVPGNVDGAGQRIFSFAYWGQQSRSSKETIAFPLGSVQQADYFTRLEGGWWKASCRVLVPDGVSLMRAFGLADVRGRWLPDMQQMPVTEWTAIDVRKHRIRLISDSVTRAEYTDSATLASLSTGAPDMTARLADLTGAEDRVALYGYQCSDLLARIDVAANQARYAAERDGLQKSIDTMNGQVSALSTERQRLLGEPTNHLLSFKNKWNNKFADMSGDHLVVFPGNGRDTQLFLLEHPPGNADSWVVTCVGTHKAAQVGGRDMPIDARDRNDTDSSQRWRLSVYNDGTYLIYHAPTGRYWDLVGGHGADGDPIKSWDNTNGEYQRWWLVPSSTLTSAADKRNTDLTSQIDGLKARLQTAQNRLAWLNDALAKREDPAALKTLHGAARKDYDAARADVATRSAALIGSIPPAAVLAMPAVAVDDRDLETRAAVLDFARPEGGTRLFESVEGNVLLTYTDPRGRLHAVPYDACADSRNASFEQWLPDGALRACVNLSDSRQAIALAAPITLPATGSTVEGWAFYPCAASSTSLQAFVAGNADAPLAIRQGRRLGVVADGFFFDSGADLERSLAWGWHHFAAATAGSETSFYLNGVKAGRATTSLPVLRFNGKTDYLAVPAFDYPTSGVTISVWARGNAASFSTTGSLVSATPQADLFTRGATREVYGNSGTPTRIVSTTVDSASPWHLYTFTHDGSYLRLYLDGELVAENPGEGKLPTGNGPLRIGWNGANEYFTGDIAEVSYWKVARGLYDIRNDYLFRPLKGDEPNLIGYWRMETSGDPGSLRVKDLTGKTGDAVVGGAPTAVPISTVNDRPIQKLGNLGSPSSTGIGPLAEVRLWDSALGEAEIAANARSFLTGNEPGLLGYFPLDEGSGALVRNRSASGGPDGQIDIGQVPAAWQGFTAAVGNPAAPVLHLPDTGTGYVKAPPVSLAGRSFTVECWARRSGAQPNTVQFFVTAGTTTANAGFYLGIQTNNRFTMGFYQNDVGSTVELTDTDWHHYAATYDQPKKLQTLYCDGVQVATRTAPADLAQTGDLLIGRSDLTGSTVYFRGDIAELRFWDGARAPSDIRSAMRRRLAGTEPGLLALYPLDAVDQNGCFVERCAGTWVGQQNGAAQPRMSTTLPIAMAPTVTACEYSTVRVDSNGLKQAMMRRFYAGAAGGAVNLLPEQRVEALTLAWVGNTQIRPTLLGYIEGAPPVPSENMTLQEDYDTATSVTLSTSEETTYTWRRSELHSQAFNIEGFAGVGWDLSAGIGVIKKATEGSAGAEFNFEHRRADTKDSVATASSLLNTSDTLYITGQREAKPMSRVLGRRWIPKNIGYATVLSGMADVFVTRLQRSGRMVSYDIRPVDGVPLDVNTITFLINPAYTLNGSLDGMVGSMPADPTFYGHVPAMRAQYGSLYPASYFRLKEAYALKDAIDRQDKERESFFYNFDATEVDSLQAEKKRINTPSVGPAKTTSSGGVDDKAMADQKEALESESKKRQEEIEARTGAIGDRVRAVAAFGEWQLRMGDIQLKAGKRNIVNTYVWDADGGLHAEQQSFASTIEHSISTEVSNGGGAGASIDAMVSVVKFSLKAMGSGSEVNTTGKSLSISKSLELNVALMPDPVIHIENNGITDLRDNPLLPGEKVGRYRFMSFYLEGSTDHFFDFFDEVVDPEWLMSNSEEARALRQARTGKPNKPWRVLHRVTYVERPALKNFGSR